jgi:hypothetical protein
MALFADPDQNAVVLHHRYTPRVTDVLRAPSPVGSRGPSTKRECRSDSPRGRSGFECVKVGETYLLAEALDELPRLLAREAGAA